MPRRLALVSADAVWMAAGLWCAVGRPRACPALRAAEREALRTVGKLLPLEAVLAARAVPCAAVAL